MTRKIKWMGWGLFWLTLAVPLSAQDNAPTGFAMLDQRSVLVWSEGTNDFRLWLVHLDAKPQWTKLADPPSLTMFKHGQSPKDDTESAYVTVNVTAGMVRLIWLEHSGCEEKEVRSRPFPNDVIPCEFTLYQASETTDAAMREGAWRVTQSRMKNTPMEEMRLIDQIEMVDRRHGWMLVDGDSQMQQMPQDLLTTADGDHWTRQAATGMPLGLDWPEMLLPQSASEAWFVRDDAARTGEGPIKLFHTTDGGRTWKASDVPFPPGCKNCREDGLWKVPARNGLSCFDAALSSYDDEDPDTGGQPQTGSSVDRYCRSRDGHGWMAATQLPALDGGGKDAEAAGEVYADAQLGFSELTRAPTYANSILYETTDGGEHWRPAAQASPGKTFTVQQAEARGDDLLVLFWSYDDGSTTLKYSPDRGATWMAMTMPR